MQSPGGKTTSALAAGCFMEGEIRGLEGTQAAREEAEDGGNRAAWTRALGPMEWSQTGRGTMGVRSDEGTAVS